MTMIQDALFDLPRPASARREKSRRRLPDDVPWLDQYPGRSLSGEEVRKQQEDCMRWWSAYTDELVSRAGGESRYLQDCYDRGTPPDPEREEHARRYARAQRDPLRAMTLGSVPELDAIKTSAGKPAAAPRRTT
jgi:hypothetical protein